MLWHRFDAVMQLHNESVRGVDVKKMIPPPDTRPHYVGYFRFIYTRIVFFFIVCNGMDEVTFPLLLIKKDLGISFLCDRTFENVGFARPRSSNVRR